MPPPAGKTALLRALAGRHPTGGVASKAGNIDAAITFNGLKASELAARSINLSKLAAYAPQEDLHEPLLTVRETFRIAHELSTPRPPADAPDDVRREWETRVDSVIGVLGLRECQHTKVGNEMIRGISGGQKKRVTVGEALLSNARIIALDEATNGLDASTALELVSFMRDWAHMSRGTVAMALQAPTPEILATFDDVILLAEGYELYHGPPAGLSGYLSALGFHQPAFQVRGWVVGHALAAAWSDPRPPIRPSPSPPPALQDIADFSILFATSPALALRSAEAHADDDPEEGAAGGDRRTEAVSTSVPTLAAIWRHSRAGRAVMGGSTPTTTAAPSADLALVDSRSAALNSERPSPGSLDGEGIRLDSAATKTQYASRLGGSLAVLLLLIDRQQKLLWRNSDLLGAKIGQSVGRGGGCGVWARRAHPASLLPSLCQIFMGFVLGSLFYKLSTDDFTTRIGLCLFAPVLVSYSNQANVPVVSGLSVGRRDWVQRRVCPEVYPALGALIPRRHPLPSQAYFSAALVRRQIAGGMYNATAYAFAAMMSALPLQLFATTIFAVIIYFMTGFTATAANFFFFLW